MGSIAEGASSTIGLSPKFAHEFCERGILHMYTKHTSLSTASQSYWLRSKSAPDQYNESDLLKFDQNQLHAK